SPDPLAEEFPGWSPYVYAANNPIMLVDRDGLAPTLPPIYDPTGSFSALRLTSWNNAAVFHSFETGQNTSLGHLQKFLWAPRNGNIRYHINTYNTIKGTVGEAIVYKRFLLPTGRDNVAAETFLRNMGSMGRNSMAQRAAMGSSTGYELHPNSRTDLSFVAQGTGFVHDFVVPSSATIGQQLGFADPYAVVRSVYNNASTKFIYEIKTNKKDGLQLYRSANLMRGLEQLKDNPEVMSGAAVPVLLLDHDYFLEALNSDYEAVKDVSDQLRALGGGIFTMEGLNSDAVQAIESLKKQSADTPMKENYFDYNEKD
ncbi:MAG: hypothetical protein AAGN35_24705, partial [Bacteroidota bacterium]